MDVRRAALPDAAALASVAVRSIGELGASHYSANQLALWQSSFTVTGLEWIISNTETYVVDDPSPCGLANLVDRSGGGGELDLLYVDPPASGRGVARLLVDTVERAAIRRGHRELWADASLLALPVLSHLGFSVVTTNTKTVRGEVFENTWVKRSVVKATG